MIDVDYFCLCARAIKVIKSIEICTMKTICFIVDFAEYDEIIRLYLDDLGYTYEVINCQSMGHSYNTST